MSRMKRVSRCRSGGDVSKENQGIGRVTVTTLSPKLWMESVSATARTVVERRQQEGSFEEDVTRNRLLLATAHKTARAFYADGPRLGDIGTKRKEGVRGGRIEKRESSRDTRTTGDKGRPSKQCWPSEKNDIGRRETSPLR